MALGRLSWPLRFNVEFHFHGFGFVCVVDLRHVHCERPKTTPLRCVGYLFQQRDQQGMEIYFVPLTPPGPPAEPFPICSPPLGALSCGTNPGMISRSRPAS